MKFRSVLLMALIALSVAACERSHPIKNTVTIKPNTVRPKIVLHPVIVELINPRITSMGDAFGDTKSLAEWGANINQWQNRVTIFAMVRNPDELTREIKENFHGSYDSLVVFDKPFYNFNRKLCTDTTSSKEWTNIFLTANLVADPKLQQEYLDYHKTQFQKWPEVSQGFCNAQFQQLLVFKSGRQLIIVISIPKGKTLDELNPLTTKNNPRVDEWNKTMSKYQEGLPGTKKGETWVFLKPIGR